MYICNNFGPQSTASVDGTYDNQLNIHNHVSPIER
jgi:hypothetical protein